MENAVQKLTLHQPVTYQIKVPGVLDESWSDWDVSAKIALEYHAVDQPVTVIIATFDQAALQGFLRRLYSLGLPLISVIYVKFG